LTSSCADVLDQHIENPSKLKTGLEGSNINRHEDTAHQAPFFLFGELVQQTYIKERADNCGPRLTIIGSASLRPAL